VEAGLYAVIVPADYDLAPYLKTEADAPAEEEEVELESDDTEDEELVEF